MSSTQYKLGRDAISGLPGVANCDIVDATVNVAADQLDITTYGATALTEAKFRAGLIDITIDVVCTNTSATLGTRGPCEIASLPDSSFDAIVLDIKESANPQGRGEFTVTYGLIEQTS